MNSKPRKVVAKITRTVTEIATITLDRHGQLEEVIEILDECELLDFELNSIRTVLTEHD